MNDKIEIQDESNCGGSWEWFACDAQEQIALFDNGGFGISLGR